MSKFEFDTIKTTNGHKHTTLWMLSVRSILWNTRYLVVNDAARTIWIRFRRTQTEPFVFVRLGRKYHSEYSMRRKYPDQYDEQTTNRSGETNIGFPLAKFQITSIHGYKYMTYYRMETWTIEWFIGCIWTVVSPLQVLEHVCNSYIFSEIQRADWYFIHYISIELSSEFVNWGNTRYVLTHTIIIFDYDM